MKRKQQLQNNGVGWVRGATIGQGSFSTVSLATNSRPKTRQNIKPATMAVKWAELSQLSLLENEKEILSDLEGCPHILRCYGSEITNNDKGQKFYNLLLEYSSGEPDDASSRLEETRKDLQLTTVAKSADLKQGRLTMDAKLGSGTTDKDLKDTMVATSAYQMEKVTEGIFNTGLKKSAVEYCL
ncbi:hypothetical protein HHK36_019991 [Tetracentron sinense]|uniref:Protein kinase domain-containing protein n=1 Tax=Tetracentron sinense TaxID=13715 RepID=A0A835D7Z2_TETSI|nr:hypothetical protein HHK36_019991 [Tetracentron sinense]